MINKATIDLVKEFEGLRLKAYADPVGIITIGYGTKIENGKNIAMVPTSAGAALAAGTPPAGPITWACNGAGTTLSAKYRPAECR